jgi:hypothetical protein
MGTFAEGESLRQLEIATGFMIAHVPILGVWQGWRFQKTGGGQNLWKVLDQWLKLKLLSVLCMIWWVGALIHGPCLQLLLEDCMRRWLTPISWWA